MSEPPATHAIPSPEHRQGLLFGLGAYGWWGFFPIYIKALMAASALEILCHRVLWAQVFVLLVVWKRGRLAEVWSAFRDRHTLRVLALTTVLVSVNWLLYIYSVVSGRVLESSLGYYMNPLVNVLLGVGVLKERLDRSTWIAVALAASGVVWLTASTGAAPWLSLGLAASFGSYGLLRKRLRVGSLAGLSVETTMLLPLTAAFVAWTTAAGRGAFLRGDFALDALLILSGPATAVPLLLFSGAVRRLPLSTLGFLQYLSPSVQFVLAVTLFGETLGGERLVAFAFIWAAVVLFATTRR